ncbi:MAG: S1 family peptidase [Gammaproteobacteria bacterium]|nr:S1 family peptidase [Gammaproteobacteria bacterium]MDH5800117.1 S1 family peptidase [Gammaproteobacteria bacterium]
MKYQRIPSAILINFLLLFTALLFTASATAANFVSLDDQFARVADKAPGFGGVYFDDYGRLNIHIKPAGPEISSEEKKAVLSSLRAVFGINRMSAPMGAVKDRLLVKKPTNTGPIYHSAAYGFKDLLSWRNEIRTNIFKKLILTLDINESENRISIGVPDVARYKAKLEYELAGLGIPLHAVIIDQGKVLIPYNHMNMEFFPEKQGGIRISRVADGRTFGCTIGYNSARPFLWLNIAGFVTAAHCTEQPGSVSATTFFQPDSPNNSGVEELDPPFITLPGCPPGITCRLSDSAYVNYGGMPTRTGSVAKTTNWLASRVIDHNSPEFTVSGFVSNQLVGDVLEKVGQTTGWTVSKIESTCFDIFAGPLMDTLLLCQNQTYLESYPDIRDNLRISATGDSGAPVFYWDLNTDAKIAGILIGGIADKNDPTQQDIRRYVYSPIGNIISELGTAGIPLLAP